MKVVCAACKVTNNVAEEKMRKNLVRCGKCKEPLTPDAPGYPVEVAPGSFNFQVKESECPVLLDLWGPGCPPCRQLAPLLKDLAKELVGKIKVAKVNVQEQPAAANAFQVRGVPTLLLFKQGQEVARTAGFMPYPELRKFVAQVL